MRVGNKIYQCDLCDCMSKDGDVFFDFALPEVTTRTFLEKKVPAPLCACPTCRGKVISSGKIDGATGFFVVNYKQLYPKLRPGRLKKVLERIMLRVKSGIIIPGN